MKDNQALAAAFAALVHAMNAETDPAIRRAIMNADRALRRRG